MPSTADLSASSTISSLHKLESLASQVRLASAGVFDVPSLSDATKLFDSLASAARAAALLSTHLAERESSLPRDAFASAMQLCADAAIANTQAATATLDLVRVLAATTRRKPGRFTQELDLELDVATRRISRSRP